MRREEWMKSTVVKIGNGSQQNIVFQRRGQKEVRA